MPLDLEIALLSRKELRVSGHLPCEELKITGYNSQMNKEKQSCRKMVS